MGRRQVVGGRDCVAVGKRRVRGWDAAISRLQRDDFAAGMRRFRG